MAQHLTPGSNQSNGDSAFPPQMWMTVVPQRPYGRKSDNKKRESILFQVRGRSGITARDAIRKIYAGLEGRDDPVFVDKTSVLMLRLEVRSVVVFDVFSSLMTDNSTVAWVSLLVS